MGMKQYLKRAFRYVFRGIPNITITVQVGQITNDRLFENRTCIVTGGSSGIGFEIAKKWVNGGGKVLITGRNEEKLNTAREIIGNNCFYTVFDSSDIERCGELLNIANNILGGDVDTLVCNAGISMHEADILHVDVDSYRKQFAINLDGYYFLAREFIRRADRNKEYCILMISSERGMQCDDVPYGLTKAAVNSLVRGLAKRYYNRGIRVNGIMPGITVSNMNPQKINKDNLYSEKISSMRYFLPEEVAELAGYLLSDAAKCVSGEVIACDAGNYLNSYI